VAALIKTIFVAANSTFARTAVSLHEEFAASEAFGWWARTALLMSTPWFIVAYQPEEIGGGLRDNIMIWNPAQADQDGFITSLHQYRRWITSL
jgi:hypothetical protein